MHREHKHSNRFYKCIADTILNSKEQYILLLRIWKDERPSHANMARHCSERCWSMPYVLRHWTKENFPSLISSYWNRFRLHRLGNEHWQGTASESKKVADLDWLSRERGWKKHLVQRQSTIATSTPMRHGKRTLLRANKWYELPRKRAIQICRKHVMAQMSTLCMLVI